jgi:hypothetical protein
MALGLALSPFLFLPFILSLPKDLILIDDGYAQTYTPAVNPAVLWRHQMSARMAECYS